MCKQNKNFSEPRSKNESSPSEYNILPNELMFNGPASKKMIPLKSSFNLKETIVENILSLTVFISQKKKEVRNLY